MKKTTNQKREQNVSTSEGIPLLDHVNKITNQYVNSPLECDGLTKVFHFYLDRAQIEHRVMQGSVENVQSGDSITWHRWITLQTQQGPAIIDYRARMWLGERADVPHGVFLAEHFPHMRYQGQEIELAALAERDIHTLLEWPDIPQEWKEKYHL